MARTLGVIALALLSLCGPRAFAGAPGEKKEEVKPLPKEIVAAWERAGALPGKAVTLGTQGFEIYFAYVDPQGSKNPAAKGGIPGFRITDPKPGVLAKLPDPGQPFGLSIVSTNVDEILKDLAGLQSLQMLACPVRATKPSKKLTEAGLKELAALKNLRGLNLLRHQPVTPEMMKEVAKLKSLRHFSLQQTGVTDDAAKHVADLENLETLNLEGNKLTDATVKELVRLKELRSLWIGGNKITDKSVDPFTQMKKLRFLNLFRTSISINVGWPALRKALPDCKIYGP